MCRITRNCRLPSSTATRSKPPPTPCANGWSTTISWELLHNPRANIPASLNLVLSQARGSWLVCVDAHSTVGPSHVRSAVERLREGGWGGVGERKDGIGRTPAGDRCRGRQPVRHRQLHLPLRYQASGGSTAALRRLPGRPAAGIGRLGRAPRGQRGLRARLPAAQGRVPAAFRSVDLDHVALPAVRTNLFRQYYRFGKGKFDVARLHPTSMNPNISRRRPSSPTPLWLPALAPRRPGLAAAILAPYARSGYRFMT
jgi:succinoglycan biosynthesis protein ExoA